MPGLNVLSPVSDREEEDVIVAAETLIAENVTSHDGDFPSDDPSCLRVSNEKGACMTLGLTYHHHVVLKTFFRVVQAHFVIQVVKVLYYFVSNLQNRKLLTYKR